MINAKLKDAIAGGAHSIHVHPAVSSERSSGQGNQGDAANRPSVKFPDFSFPAVEFHGSSLFHRKSIESKPAEFMVSQGRSSGHPYANTFLAMLLLTRTIGPEEPMFAGKVTS